MVLLLTRIHDLMNFLTNLARYELQLLYFCIAEKVPFSAKPGVHVGSCTAVSKTTSSNLVCHMIGTEAILSCGTRLDRHALPSATTAATLRTIF